MELMAEQFRHLSEEVIAHKQKVGEEIAAAMNRAADCETACNERLDVAAADLARACLVMQKNSNASTEIRADVQILDRCIKGGR